MKQSTKDKIISTFFELLKSDLSVRKITVSQICKSVNINRSTFYQYFTDIYDLIDQVEDKLIADIKNRMDNEKVFSEAKLIKSNAIEYFLENGEKIALLLSSNEGNKFSLKVIENMKGQICKNLLKNQIVENFDYIMSFIMGGFMSVIQEWYFSKGNLSVEELVVLCQKMILGVLSITVKDNEYLEWIRQEYKKF